MLRRAKNNSDRSFSRSMNSRREISGIQLHGGVSPSQHLNSWTHHQLDAVFPFCYRPVDSDCPLKPLNSKLYGGLMGVFGLEAGGDGFLPHSPQKCVSSITLYSPHASSPTVMVGVRLLCKMRDSSLFFPLSISPRLRLNGVIRVPGGNMRCHGVFDIYLEERLTVDVGE